MGARPTLLFTGGTGLVGAGLYAHGLARFRVVVAVHRRGPLVPLRRGDRAVKLDLLDAGAIDRVVAQVEPELVLHAAAWSSLAACEAEPTVAQRLNVDATAQLARAAARIGAWFGCFSTDQVFAGEPVGPGYREADEARPLTVYGRTKLAAERAVLAAGGEALVLRIALVLGPSADGRAGALDAVRTAVRVGAAVRLFTDEWRTPVSVLDLARVVDAAVHRRLTGLLHVGGPERVDRLELGRRIASAFAADPAGRAPQLVAALRSEAAVPRPRDVSLRCERLVAEGLPASQPLAAALAELARIHVGGGRAPRDVR